LESVGLKNIQIDAAIMNIRRHIRKFPDIYIGIKLQYAAARCEKIKSSCNGIHDTAFKLQIKPILVSLSANLTWKRGYC
jgi:hypothetical protein